MKIVAYLTMIWFALQALFMLFWYTYLYYIVDIKISEFLAFGCIILPSSFLIVAKNKIISKLAKYILSFYSAALAIFGTLLILVASPKPMAALILLIIMVVNLTLIIIDFINHILN